MTFFQRSFLWTLFSGIWTEYGPEKTPYSDTSHAVKIVLAVSKAVFEIFFELILTKFLLLITVFCVFVTLNISLDRISIWRAGACHFFENWTRLQMNLTNLLEQLCYGSLLDDCFCFKSKEVKRSLSGFRHSLATESPLKLVKNACYSVLKALFVLKILIFLSWLFGYAKKSDWWGS